MKWELTTWSIEKLTRLYREGKLDLSPEYQRNAIWTIKSQKQLIDTILAPRPMPNFFVKRNGTDNYEMVDGQQRSRSILDYTNGFISSSDKRKFDETQDIFSQYPLTIIVISELESNESIEEFYTLVNSSGLQLNVPELRKAKYHDTKYLALCNELAGSEVFSALDLFGAGTLKRMNDVELVSELLAALQFGCGEKKEKVDFLFENDITDMQSDDLRRMFYSIVKILEELNRVAALKNSRLRQRADIYTFFCFANKHGKSLSMNAWYNFYAVLRILEEHIRPTQEHCDPLRDYARYCVSQSNSKLARENRLKLFEDLFLNDSSDPNETQRKILTFLEGGMLSLNTVDGYIALKAN